MPRLQFSIRTLLLFTLVVAVGFAFGHSMAPKYAPKWGTPKIRHTGILAGEKIWPTGRIEQYRINFVLDNCTPDIGSPEREGAARP